MNAAQKIAAKINAQSEAEAMAVYSGLRLMVMTARSNGKRAEKGAADAMLYAGDALEKRIGETRFEKLMADIDTHVFA